MDPRETPHGQVAFRFASQLVAGKFDEAHRMLSEAARQQWPAPLLESTYRGMVEYFETPPSMVMVVNTLEEWPDRGPGDIGWAYAAVAGEGGSEAVTVVVADEGGHHVVRSIEWGRP